MCRSVRFSERLRWSETCPARIPKLLKGECLPQVEAESGAGQSRSQSRGLCWKTSLTHMVSLAISDLFLELNESWLLVAG
jgi:hypothetical protein